MFVCTQIGFLFFLFLWLVYKQETISFHASCFSFLTSCFMFYISLVCGLPYNPCFKPVKVISSVTIPMVTVVSGHISITFILLQNVYFEVCWSKPHISRSTSLHIPLLQNWPVFFDQPTVAADLSKTTHSSFHLTVTTRSIPPCFKNSPLFIKPWKIQRFFLYLKHFSSPLSSNFGTRVVFHQCCHLTWKHRTKARSLCMWWLVYMIFLFSVFIYLFIYLRF